MSLRDLIYASQTSKTQTPKDPSKSTTLFLKSNYESENESETKSLREDDDDEHDDDDSSSNRMMMITSQDIELVATNANPSPPQQQQQQQQVEHEKRLSRALTNLNVLYHNNSTLLARTSVLAPPLATATACHHTRTRGIYARPSRPPKDVSKRQYATEEQLRVRRFKQERVREWTKIRSRWKRRKYDFRQETDVGNAIQNAIREQVVKDEAKKKKLLVQCAQEQLQIQQQQQLDTEPEPVDTSDEEQEKVWNRLQQASQDIATTLSQTSAVSQQQQQEEEYERPYKDRLDFWELGRTHPHVEIHYLAVNKNKRRRRQAFIHQQQLDGTSHSRTDADCTNPSDDMVLTLPSEPKRTRQVDNHYQFFPLNHNVYASLSFIQKRQFFQVAARTIVGNSGDTTSHHDQLVRLLWNIDNHRPDVILEQARQNGCRLKLFLQHQWRDRQKVAEVLGVNAVRQRTGPPALLGYTLEPQSNKRVGAREEKDVIRKYAAGPVPWSHEEANTWLERHSFLPNCSFVPVPGAIPPVPVRPFDVTGGIMFGPSDRNAQTLHSSPNGIDAATGQLIVCSLLSRITSAYYEGEDDTQQALQEQLETMLKESIQQQERKFYRTLHFVVDKSLHGNEMPLAGYYESLMLYCSVMLSGYPWHEEQVIKSDDDDDDEHYLSRTDHGNVVVKREYFDYDDEDNSYSGIHGNCDNNQERKVTMRRLQWAEIVSRLHDFCQPHVQHEGMQHFPRAFLIMGLLQIATELPERAIEILSRPLDHNTFRTPFEIVRAVLEYLESSNLLVDSAPAESSLIIAGKLEYAFHRAADNFARCLERDPTDVLHHDWHLAALAASLLLCSGNRINGRATMFPAANATGPGSCSQAQVLDLIHAEENSNRKMLPKFQNLRKDVAQAFQLLTHLAQHQKSTWAHLSVAAFLEWRQVIALLLGPKCIDASEGILATHYFHFKEWAFSEGDPDALKVIWGSHVHVDLKLDQLAFHVEQDPDNVEYWGKLASTLGPAGRTVAEEEQVNCDRGECEECRCVRSDLNVDHSVELRKKEGTWWGRDRESWWADQLLYIPKPPFTNEHQHNKLVLDIERRLRKVRKHKAEDEEGVNSCLHSSPGVDWLQHLVESEPIDFDLEDSIPQSERTQQVNQFLPLSFSEARSLCEDSLSVLNAMDFPILQNDQSREKEMICYKIVVAAHLYTVNHVLVRYGLCHLASETKGNANVRDALDSWNCLVWMKRHAGLNVPNLLREISKKRLNLSGRSGVRPKKRPKTLKCIQ